MGGWGWGGSVSLCINTEAKVPTRHKARPGFVCRLAHRSGNWPELDNRGLEEHCSRMKTGSPW